MYDVAAATNGRRLEMDGLKHGASIALHAGRNDTGGDMALLERRLALLHGTEAALVTADRLSAMALVISHHLSAGDNLVCGDQIGGEGYGFLDATCARHGHDVRFVSQPWELARWEEAIDERTQLLLTECPSDPNLFIPDLPALTALAREHFIPLVVDTTVATPVNCRAADFGADLVLSSLAGDLTGTTAPAGGAVMGGSDQLDGLRSAMLHSPGCRIHPAVAAAALDGLETLHDRMRTKRENTVAVRSYLLERRADGEVTFVNHPSLRKHPQYDLCRALMKGHPGPMISFGVRGGAKAAARFAGALQMIGSAHHPGSSRTTLIHPRSTTHAHLSDGQKKDAVIRPTLLRLCVGNEDAADILEDLERGFSAIAE